MRPHPIDYYRDRLKVSKHALDDLLEDHAELQDQIGQQLASANTAMLEAKDKLARVEARVTIRLREDHVKLTVAQVGEMLVRDASRLDAFDTYQKAREEHERWDALNKSWTARGKSISVLADLYGRQYFALRSTSTRSYDNRSHEEGRARMRDAQPTAPTRRRVE